MNLIRSLVNRSLKPNGYVTHVYKNSDRDYVVQAKVRGKLVQATIPFAEAAKGYSTACRKASEMMLESMEESSPDPACPQCANQK
jgi:hypothetical protein